MLTWLDRLNIFRLRLQKIRQLNRRWQRVAVQPGSPKVYYGRDHLQITGGGLVKINDLMGEFPNSPEAPNILYLVSSALNHTDDLLARGAKRHGIKLVVNQNGVAYSGWHGPGWRAANAPMRRILRMADHVFYQSGFCKMAADKFLGLPTGSSEILYNPVDTTFFSPAPPRQGTADPVLLLAGTHQHFYRPKVAVDTLGLIRQAYPAVRLIIAGRYLWRPQQHQARRELAEYCQSLGVAEHIELAGPYTQTEAPALLRRATVLIHPKYNDPCPRLVVEAMACGLPVVYSATGGVPEQVGPDAGIGVPGPLDWERDHPPDAADLATAAMDVLKRHAFYARSARERAVACFDVAPWQERHRQVFHHLLSQQRP